MQPNSVFGRTGISIPQVVFGSTALGNLFGSYTDQQKLDVVRQWFAHVRPPVFIDTAGKYGAGMALESIRDNLQQLNIDPNDVIISNKLAWVRKPLVGGEPTFEPGAWFDLQYDAQQRIGYDGIMECYEQGEALLHPYRSRLVSVHDPDEYLAAAHGESDAKQRYHDVLESYRALAELRDAGRADAVGVGAKDWTSIARISEDVDLDWVMLANSLTIMKNPPELLALVQRLAERKIGILNAAVFNAGFALGGSYFDYRVVSESDPADRTLIDWRKRFLRVCDQFDVPPAVACIQFSLSVPGINAIAISSSNPRNIQRTVDAFDAEVPAAFWTALKDDAVIDRDFPYLG